MKTKRCNGCNKNKSVNEFNTRKLKSGKIGYRFLCIPCERKYKNNWADKHKDELTDRAREKRKEDPERFAKTKKKYNDSHKEVSSAQGVRWRKNNPDKNREKSRRYRAQKSSVEENFTKKDEKFIKELFKNKCFNCGSKNKLQIDHHYPLSKGNPLTIFNAVLLCKSCNCSKGNKTPEEFYNAAQIKRLDKLLNGTRNNG